MSEYKWKLGELKVGDEVYSNTLPDLHGTIEEILSKDGIFYAVKMNHGTIVQESLLSLKSEPDPEILHNIKFTLKGQHKQWIKYVGRVNDWLKSQKIDGLKRYKGAIPLLDKYYYGSSELIFDSYRQNEPDMDLLLWLVYQAGEREGENRVIESVKNNLGLS